MINFLYCVIFTKNVLHNFARGRGKYMIPLYLTSLKIDPYYVSWVGWN
jgi:hypothetical protein